MKNVTTHAGIDAHKKNLFVAMLLGREKTPVTWQLANEPRSLPGRQGPEPCALRPEPCALSPKP